ncbi:hypothetical protein VOLCADRAFT_88175 [Volvox carteri f. nagariensis]|uniref:Uncharacterized protein n=1 Tax=Volvox carteri f. nagariensis TaxID=3068 RepID=D8TNH0_VOLCA|nr:uncharacterized protein VOLCADRAFT_88175 [Volvox carteri f. nagariensis]EFJ50838.1 hypothetical protein VOLCADRAFT_88175 [Volvox carteri f. nagariensis]|eukprot:XP_002947850.1 hypothetical protein VOLCADRAFT_88175 [Volvox carteri f. nagariensis]
MSFAKFPPRALSLLPTLLPLPHLAFSFAIAKHFFALSIKSRNGTDEMKRSLIRLWEYIIKTDPTARTEDTRSLRIKAKPSHYEAHLYNCFVVQGVLGSRTCCRAVCLAEEALVRVQTLGFNKQALAWGC